MKPVLIVGGDSMIGAAVRAGFERRGVEVVATSRRDGSRYRVDLAEDPDCWCLPDSCAAVILCAARSRLQECEEHPAETRRVNVVQTLELAGRLRERGAFLVFLSTNLVFRGGSGPYPPPAPTDPVSEYARQKVEVERALIEGSDAAAVVRLSKVVYPEMPLARSWVEALRRGESVRAFANLRFSPISSVFVADALRAIADRRVAGITHLSGSGQLSYFDFATAIARRLGVAPTLVLPTEAPDGPARSAVLDAERTTRELALHPPDIAQTVRELIDSLI